MDIAWTLARVGAPHGATVAARQQTAGRGRTGGWESAPGGAYLTVILRGRCDRPGIVPLMAGVATAEALETFGVQATLRWPNDVLLGGLKVAGILVEASWGAEPVILVGVGVNVRNPVPASGTSLALQGSSAAPHDVAGAVARSIRTWWERLPDVRAAYQARDALRGTRVERDGRAGTAVGVDEDGRLVLETDEGRLALDQPLTR